MIMNTRLNLWELRDKHHDVRKIQNDFHIRRVSENNVNIISKAYRNEEIIQSRLKEGYTGYWIEQENKCIHVHWYAAGVYYLWDIRGNLIIPEGSYYIFDVYTAPEYRRLGYSDVAITYSILEKIVSQTGTVYALTQERNNAANFMFARIGFKNSAGIRFIQIPPVRYYRIKNGYIIKRYIDIMKLHRDPLAIDLRKMININEIK